MAAPEQIKAWAHRTAPRDWYGACAGLTYNTIVQNGGTSDAYGSATAAFNATRIEGHRPQDAPAGAIHYWSYVGRDWRGIVGDWGHVAVDIYGGGQSILSATRRYREQWAIGAGLISVAAQTVPGMTYLGWSMTYGRRGRISITVPTGDGSTPFTPSKPKEWDEMATRQESKEAFVEAFLQVLTDPQYADVRRAAGLVREEDEAGYFIIHGTGRQEQAADPRNGVWLTTEGVLSYLKDGSVGFFNSWSTTDKRSLASRYGTFPTGGNPGAFDDFVRTRVEDWPADAAQVDAYLRAKRKAAGA